MMDAKRTEPTVAIGPGVRRGAPSRRAIGFTVAAVGLIAAMALDTKVVKIGAGSSAEPGAFSAATYGESEFPKVQAAVERRAVEATTLARAIAKNAAAAGKRYGVMASAGPELPVKFAAVVGKGDFGTYDVTISGLPKTVAVQVQTGPAITGTDLRDATGTITFGQFTNQIEYQNAGSALNKQMKKDVLARIDTANLRGKTIAVVGVFLLTDPKSWLVTPVRLDVR